MDPLLWLWRYSREGRDCFAEAAMAVSEKTFISKLGYIGYIT
jgi:hypothetical protein